MNNVKKSIGWAELTWNPIVGCSKCSPGCDHCYAERMANRLAGMERAEFESHEHGDGGIDYSEMYANGKYINVVSNGKWNGESNLDDEYRLTSSMFKLRKMKKHRFVFVSSMGDLFHHSIAYKSIDKIVEVQSAAPQHTYIWLTKRPERMRQYINNRHDWKITGKNVWCGVTVCNQDEADEKIPVLLQTPTEVRFVSIEPMLGPIKLTEVPNDITKPTCNPLTGQKYPDNLGKTGKINWVIVGGESGPGARPMHPDWVRLIRDQCEAAGVPFFFKQWGEWIPSDHEHLVRRPLQSSEVLYINKDGTFSETGKGNQPTDVLMHKAGKKRTGRLLCGKTYDDRPKKQSGNN